MKTSFQDGCNTIYDAIINLGVTPEDKSPSSIAFVITNKLNKRIFSVAFSVSVVGKASNNAGSVNATAKNTYVLKDDGTLSDSGISKSSSAAVSYISNCSIASLTLSDITYDETLDNVTFKVSTSITASNGSGTARCNASQSFSITNKDTVTAIDTISKTSSTVTQISSISINSISVSLV